MKNIRFILTILLVGFLVVSQTTCGGGGGGGGNGASSGSAGQNTAVLAPNAIELDTATTSNLSSVSADGATIIFSGTTPQLKSLKTGDVIISGVTGAAPRGLLKKVVSTNTAADGSVQVITSPATLTDAFQELHLQGTIASDSSAITADKSAQRKELSTSTTAIFKISFKIPETNFKVSGQYDSTLSGNYIFSPVLDYEIDISYFTLKKFKLVKGACHL